MLSCLLLLQGEEGFVCREGVQLASGCSGFKLHGAESCKQDAELHWLCSEDGNCRPA